MEAAGAIFLFNATDPFLAEAPPLRPKPLTQDGLLGLFDAETTGADFVLEPANDADMRGKFAGEVKSLEVVYDDV